MKMLIGITVAALLATPAAAAQFATILNGANETVPTGSPGTGAGTLLLSTDATKIKVDMNWSGLTAPAVAAHAHCCALQGANAGVAIGFDPAPATSGSYSRFFDLTATSTYTAGFIAANGGSAATARLAFLAGLDTGLVYYNIHTSTFPGGEIRGNLAAGAVPESASWAMLITGFGLTGAVMRRRAVKATA